MQDLSVRRKTALLKFCQNLGISFKNLQLLHQALTHTSYANEAKNQHLLHNERLEFLGDAVLELSTSTYLYHHFSKLPEGELTKARSGVVCEASLYKQALKISLGEYLLLGHGEIMTGGKERPSILADAFEAVIGAIYLDQGYECASKYVIDRLAEELVVANQSKNLQDYKTLLQERVQRHPGQKILYELLGAKGPDHAKVFDVAVRINGLAYGTGRGRTKKEAEQKAAEKALKRFIDR